MVARKLTGKLLAIIMLLMICGQFSMALSSRQATSEALAQTTTLADADVNPYGVNTFFDKEVEDWKKERTLQLIQQAGISWIKQQFPWDEIEFKKGYFYDDKFKKSSWQKFDQFVDLAAKYNVKVVARIDRTPQWARQANTTPGAPPTNYQDFADFLEEFVKHYKGKISYIQVWNEPNLGAEWFGPVNPAKYTEMLKLAYTSIKKADSNVKVLSAPLAMNTENFKERTNLNELDFLSEMYQAGAKPYFDILSANGYGLEFPPEDAPDPQKLNFRRVELLHNIMVKNEDDKKAIWFNEYGWNASPPDFPADKLIWRRVTEQQQADYTIRGIKYAKTNWPWAGVMFIWYFRQVGDIPADRSDYYFQMITPDFQPKPVYDAVKKDALAYLVQKNQPTPAPATVIPSPVPTINATATSATLLRPSATAGTTSASPVASPTTTTNNSNSDGGSPVGLIIAAAVVALAGIGGALYFFAGPGRRRS